MGTIRLIPSTYSSSNSSYATVYSNESNMYHNTDNTKYTSLRGRGSSTTTAYYIFIRGFNFNDIPSNVYINNFVVKIKCYRKSNQRTGDNYRLRLSSSTSINKVIPNTITSTEIGTSTSVITIPIGNLTWSELKSYGSNFSIVVPLSSTSSSRPYIYVYGAEIEVNYEEDTGTSTAYVKVNGNWVAASAVYKKINGSWVQQQYLSSVFEDGVDYKYGS